MDRTMLATHQAQVAGAARPCAGFGRIWRHVGNVAQCRGHRWLEHS